MTNEPNEFSAAPRVVNPKKKYKEKEIEEQEQDEIKLIYNNLMWDRRVVRGNTYSGLVTTSKNAEISYANTSKPTRKAVLKLDIEEPVELRGKRANIEIYTDEQVETLTDKPPKYEQGSQTDFKIQKQIVRHQMAEKEGMDIETQIWDNDLFDFDYEVVPLLSVLCARTLEISRMEVLQEQQLSIMKLRQMQLQLQAHEDEVVKVKNMYNKQQQLQKQNAKRLQNYRKQKVKKIQTHQRLFSRVIGKNYLRDLQKNTMNYVEGQGFFRNQIHHQLIQKFLPGLYRKSIQEQIGIDNEKKAATKLVEEAMELALKEVRFSKEVERSRKNQIIRKREELAREKLSRKMMKEEQKYMIKFLEDEKVYLEKLEEEERRKAEQLEGEGENAQEQAD